MVARGAVFSAHAEVVPLQEYQAGILERILRARGGSSLDVPHNDYPYMYSPRTRR